MVEQNLNLKFKIIYIPTKLNDTVDMRQERLTVAINTLNSMILEFKARNPSIADSDVALALDGLKSILHKKQRRMTALEAHLFDSIVGLSSLARYSRREIMECLNTLQKSIEEYMNLGKNYLDSISTLSDLVPFQNTNN